MNLRRKLLTLFAGLGLLSLTVAGVTVWTTFQWRTTEKNLEAHYMRSLLLQRVRVAAFRAFQEVPDAVTAGDPDAPLEFEELLRPAEDDFRQWAALAETDEERRQVEQVQRAFDNLVKEARAVLALVKDGRHAEARRTMEERLEDRDFVPFQQLSDAAVASDNQYREVVRAETQDTRRTAQVVLAIAAFGTLSLVLLLAAYLSSDIFGPLREVEKGLQEAAGGNLQHRLSEERGDELGAVGRAFNRMVESVALREQMAGLAAIPGEAEEGPGGPDWAATPSRLTLHHLVSRLRSRLTRLRTNGTAGHGGNGAARDGQETLDEIDRLLYAVARITEFGFPLDLNLTCTDIRALIYDVVLRFHGEFVERGVSLELLVAPEVGQILVDRLKLREALAELVRNALGALPERGGRLALRCSVRLEEAELLIEVADNGEGAETPRAELALAGDGDGGAGQERVGLALTQAVVEKHGGQLEIDTRPGEGTYVQLRLPLRE